MKEFESPIVYSPYMKLSVTDGAWPPTGIVIGMRLLREMHRQDMRLAEDKFMRDVKIDWPMEIAVTRDQHMGPRWENAHAKVLFWAIGPESEKFDDVPDFDIQISLGINGGIPGFNLDCKLLGLFQNEITRRIAFRTLPEKVIAEVVEFGTNDIDTTESSVRHIARGIVDEFMMRTGHV